MSSLVEAEAKKAPGSGEDGAGAEIAPAPAGASEAGAGAAEAAGKHKQAAAPAEDGCTLVAKWQGKTIELPDLAKSTTIGEVKVGAAGAGRVQHGSG